MSKEIYYMLQYSKLPEDYKKDLGMLGLKCLGKNPTLKLLIIKTDSEERFSGLEWALKYRISDNESSFKKIEKDEVLISLLEIRKRRDKVKDYFMIN